MTDASRPPSLILIPDPEGEVEMAVMDRTRWRHRTTEPPAVGAERPAVAGDDQAVAGDEPAVAAERAAVATDAREVAPGVSLARGPALVMGTLLLAAGLYFLYRLHGFPKLSNFPSGPAHVEGKAFLGIFGVNGWSGMLTAIAGGLLLFGAAQHMLAKAMSVFVAVVLAAAAIIALARHGNVLGLAAANGWTELGWGGSAVILLGTALLPRRRRVIVRRHRGAAVPAV
jgi:hypothetical protein